MCIKVSTCCCMVSPTVTTFIWVIVSTLSIQMLPTHLPHLWVPLLHCSNMVIALAFVTPIRRLNICSCHEETDLSAPTCALLFFWMFEGDWPHWLFPLSHFLKSLPCILPWNFSRNYFSVTSTRSNNFFLHVLCNYIYRVLYLFAQYSCTSKAGCRLLVL